jgi:hypothetical protein
VKRNATFGANTTDEETDVTFRFEYFVAAAALSVAACDDMAMTETATAPTRTGAGAAEAACIAAVNVNMGSGGSTITNSEFSEAGTLVMVRSDDGTTWRCLASNDGVVEDLSVT